MWKRTKGVLRPRFKTSASDPIILLFTYARGPFLLTPFTCKPGCRNQYWSDDQDRPSDVSLATLLAV